MLGGSREEELGDNLRSLDEEGEPIVNKDRIE